MQEAVRAADSLIDTAGGAFLRAVPAAMVRTAGERDAGWQLFATSITACRDLAAPGSGGFGKCARKTAPCRYY